MIRGLRARAATMTDPTRHKESNSVKRLLPALAAVLLAVTIWSPALAGNDGAAGIEVRVWQDTTNGMRLHISARPADGSWNTLSTVRLLVDDEGSTEAMRRFQTVTIVTPLPETDARGATAKVEIRVELPLDGPGAPVVIARGEGHSWTEAVSMPVALDRTSTNGWFRYGNVDLEVPVSNPSHRHLALKEYLLSLINAERAEAGVDPVRLGANDAAQLHAEASLAGCYSSHWGQDGLKPYMRYSLAGGYQSNTENGLGTDYCASEGERRAITDPRQEVREAMDLWMSSSGHRDNILRPVNLMVSIGLAWDRYNFRAYQQFEGDYVEYEILPAFSEGSLELSGTVRNGVRFSHPNDLRVGIRYDPPPQALTLGQVTRTYCSDSGEAVAGLRRELPAGRFYTSDEFTRTHRPCPNPYDMDPDAPAPTSSAEAHQFWAEAREASQAQPEVTMTVPWVTAETWVANETLFTVRADLTDVLTKHGPGVYTVLVWGTLDGEFVTISRYSIFHEADPPEGYAQHR